MNIAPSYCAIRSRAFTLIEILLSTAIMAVLLVCVHSAFFGALRLRQKTFDATERTLPLEETLDIIQRDLANIVTSTNGVFFGPLQTTMQTNNLPGQVGPDFYTTGGELDGIAPWGNMEKVDYCLTASTNGYMGPGQTLMRDVTHNLLPVNNQPMPEEQEILLNGVQSLTFLYYDGVQWQTAWDTTQQTNLPLAIKVQLLMATPQNGGSLAANTPLEVVVPVDVMLTTNPIVAIQ